MYLRTVRQILLTNFLIAIFLQLGCGVKAKQHVSRRNMSTPRVIDTRGIEGIIQALPSYATFAFSGLSFFHNRLYLSSNIGILEVAGGEKRLYKWSDNDDVVSGPWYDQAKKRLWFYHRGINKLILYDGSNWEAVDLPFPKEGYTREDILRGPIGRSNANDFWVQIGYHAWRWNDKECQWLDEPQPRNEIFFGIVPVGEDVLLIMRRDPIPLDGPPDKPNSDVVFIFRDGLWREIPNRTGSSFFTKSAISAIDAAYILTDTGSILRLTSLDITMVDTPGDCEAIAASSSGTLLASLLNSGIYEYTERWQLRFQSPYSPTDYEHRAYLAESEGRVAFAIVPKLPTSADSKNQLGRTKLWLSEGNKLMPVALTRSN